MKNSTLLCLFFIGIGIPLTLASSGPSTLTPESAPEQSTLILSDTTNSAEAAQLQNSGSLTTGVSEKSLAPEMDMALIKKLAELIAGEEYGEVEKLKKLEKWAGMENDVFVKHLSRVVTTPNHFKGLLQYLKQNDMVSSFLVHGDIDVVKKGIAKKDLLETYSHGRSGNIKGALAIALNEGNHKRAMELFVATHERPAWKDKFGDFFLVDFFNHYHPSENSMPFKRFLTLYGEEFGKMYPATFETVLEWLMCMLGSATYGTVCGNVSVAQKLLPGLIGQPSILTPVAFAGGLLTYDIDRGRNHLIKFGYREAIEEGLKEKYKYGGRELWEAMVRELPEQFSGEYPTTDEARADALKNYRPTKQDREIEWAEMYAEKFLLKLLTKFKEPAFNALIPQKGWSIVAEYVKNSATWVDV